MFFGIDVTNAKEPEVAPHGVYTLQITNVEVNQTEDKNNLEITLGFTDNPTFQSLRHWIGLPKKDDPEDKVRIKQLMLRRFLESFHIEFSDQGFDLANFYGATATVPVVVEAAQDRAGNITGRNVNRLNLPRLASEKEAVTFRKSRRA